MTVVHKTVDLWDPDTFLDGPPHDVFDALRAEDPVYWNERSDVPNGGFWVLTRFAENLEVSRDTTRFTSSAGFTDKLEDPDHLALFAENIMYRDPPAHTAHRLPLSRMFSRRSMEELEGRVRRIVVQVLDSLPASGEFNWVRKVAAEIPSRVVSDVLGVPEEDHLQLVEWADAIFGRDGTPDAEARFRVAVGSIMHYSTHIKEIKREHPDSDVMSVLVSAEVDGCALSESALDHWFLSVTQAGFETTHTLIAQGMWLLLQRPDLVESLQADPASAGRMTEEMLRYITPVNFMARTAVESLTLGGHTIRSGDYVTMWYAAANRDPAVFNNPHQFDVLRKPNNHQAFGAPGSPHYCLGAHLARLEMRILLEELAARMCPFEQRGPAVRKPGVFMNALTSLPVALTATSR